MSQPEEIPNEAEAIPKHQLHECEVGGRISANGYEWRVVGITDDHVHLLPLLSESPARDDTEGFGMGTGLFGIDNPLPPNEYSE